MILVRPYTNTDKPAIQAMHSAMGIDYEQPDWNRVVLGGIVERDGTIQMAAMMRKTVEVYLLIDPEAGRKRDKLANLLMLHRELIAPSQRLGVDDWHCWLPPDIEAGFGKLLMNLGWKKPLWPCFSREVK